MPSYRRIFDSYNHNDTAIKPNRLKNHVVKHRNIFCR